MRRPVFAALMLVVMTAQVLAGPRKVIVLPLDGNADAPTRAKLSASVQKLARVIDGQLKPGGTSFADTAAAVGCDPSSWSCAETVRTTLNVDEIIYGTATVQDGQVTVVVRRKAKDGPPREISTSLGVKDSPDRIEPELLPLFTGGGSIVDIKPATCPDGATPDPQGKCSEAKPPDVICADGKVAAAGGKCPEVIATPKPKRTPASTDRALGISATVGGGAMLLIGLALWSSKSSLQNDIDDHPTDTLSDFQELQQLEDKAGSRATFGNLLVFGGAALGGIGAWLLWRDRKARAIITPAPIEGGATVTFTLVGGLR